MDNLSNGTLTADLDALRGILCPVTDNYGSPMNAVPFYTRRSVTDDDTHTADHAAPTSLATQRKTNGSAAGVPSLAHADRWTLLRQMIEGDDVVAPVRGQLSGGTAMTSSTRARREDATPAPDTTEETDRVTETVVDLLDNLVILYAPNTSDVRKIIQVANKTFDQAATMLELAKCAYMVNNSRDENYNWNDVPFDTFDFAGVWKGFATEEDMVKHVSKTLF